MVRGHFSEGQEHLKRALERAGAQGAGAARAKALNRAGDMAYSQGDYASARALLEESLSLYREMGNRVGIVWSLIVLGRVVLDQGDHASSQALLEQSLRLYREVGGRVRMAECLESMAASLLGQAEIRKAVRLWGASHALLESIGTTLPPRARKRYDQQVAQARSALGEDAFTAAWEEGRALTWEQAVAYALEETPQ
jgi:tetratricopeptide (TPR) repeat protein